MKPKYLVIAFILIATLWSGFWFVAASRFEEQLDRQSEKLTERGFAFNYKSRLIKGFPFRLIAEHQAFQVTGTGSGFGWGVNGDELNLVAIPWNSGHIILDAPNAGVALSMDWVSAGDVSREFTSIAQAASLRVSISTRKGMPRRVSLQMAAVEGETNLFGIGPFASRDLQFHLRWPHNSDDNGEQLSEPAQLEPALRVKDFEFKGRSMGALGPVLEQLVIQSAITGDEVPNRSKLALQSWRDNGGTLELPILKMRWGPLEVDGSGTLAIDDSFRPIGALSLDANGLDAALATLEADTRISDDASELLRLTLDLLSAGSDNGKAPVPVSIQNGVLSIGPVGIIQTGALYAKN